MQADANLLEHQPDHHLRLRTPVPPLTSHITTSSDSNQDEEIHGKGEIRDGRHRK